MLTLETHGTAALRSGRVLIETDYRPGDRGPGLLVMAFEDQETGERVEGSIRLDPWSGGEYQLIEPAASYVVICGAQAIIAIDAVSLAWLSSVALEYEEGERIGSPWHVELERRLVLATERAECGASTNAERSAGCGAVLLPNETAGSRANPSLQVTGSGCHSRRSIAISRSSSVSQTASQSEIERHSGFQLAQSPIGPLS